MILTVRQGEATDSASFLDRGYVSLRVRRRDRGVSGAVDCHHRHVWIDVLNGIHRGVAVGNLIRRPAHVDGTSLAGVIGYAINGLAARYPDLHQVVDRNVNTNGRAFLNDVSTMCLLDIRMQYSGKRSAEWTNSGQSLGDVIRSEPTALRVLEEQRIGKRAPAVPVMLAGGATDETIPVGQVEELGRNWCEQGTAVHFHHEMTPRISNLNHVAAAVTNFQPAVQYLTDRLAGVPAPNDCGSF